MWSPKISFVILTLVQFVICEKILIILPTSSLSHQLFFRPIIKELSLRGHQVTCLTSDPMKNASLTNLTEIDTHDAAYKLLNVQGAFAVQKKLPHIRGFATQLLKLVDNALDTLAPMIGDPNEHFDLLIVEALSYAALYGFRQRFNCPMVGLASLETRNNILDALGMPPNPSYYGTFYGRARSDLTFWERLHNFWITMDFRIFYHFTMLPAYDQLIRKYFDESYDVWSLEKSFDLVLTNTNPVFHVPRPRTPNYIEIGGIHLREKKSLPQDLQELLDSSLQGVVYFSLGSNVKSNSLSDNTRESILKAFEKLPYNVLWKWENDTLPNKPANVFTRHWLPQADILDHPKVKVFITQGGLHSIEEAIGSKVPMIGIPFGGDQDFNIDRVVALGVGRRLFLDELSTEQLFDSIMDVATNASYKNNIIKLANQIWDQETDPLERAIWWIEYVIRHRGAQHLRCPAADLPWYQYLLLDVIGFILVCVISLFITVISVIKILRRFVFKKLKSE